MVCVCVCVVYVVWENGVCGVVYVVWENGVCVCVWCMYGTDVDVETDILMDLCILLYWSVTSLQPDISAQYLSHGCIDYSIYPSPSSLSAAPRWYGYYWSVCLFTEPLRLSSLERHILIIFPLKCLNWLQNGRHRRVPSPHSHWPWAQIAVFPLSLSLSPSPSLSSPLLPLSLSHTHTHTHVQSVTF